MLKSKPHRTIKNAPDFLRWLERRCNDAGPFIVFDEDAEKRMKTFIDLLASQSEIKASFIAALKKSRWTLPDDSVASLPHRNCVFTTDLIELANMIAASKRPTAVTVASIVMRWFQIWTRGGERYVVATFDDVGMRFVSKKACVLKYGVAIDVRIPTDDLL